MKFLYIDSHCHLDNPKLKKTVGEIIRESEENGVIAFVNSGYDLPSSLKGVEISEKYSAVYTTVGIHPHDAQGVPKDYLLKLEELVQKPKVVALGEMGLDYYYQFSPKEVQKEIFCQQLELAFSLKKPFVIHQRDAMGDMLEILKRFPNPQYKGVFHCYSGSVEIAKELIKMGYMLSIAGPVTFKNAKKTVEVVKEIPLEYLLVETDCPYLTPEPFRGKVNYPYYVKFVIEKIAEIKGISFDKVAYNTTKNSINFFKLSIELNNNDNN